MRDKYTKNVGYIGLGLGTVGLGLTELFGDVLHQTTPAVVSFIAALVGGNLAVRSLYMKHKIRKLMAGLLEKRTKTMDLNELERRVKEKDFRIPEPSEKEREEILTKGYTERIIYEVQKREHNVGKHAWTIGGICVIGAGVYSTLTYATFPFSGPLAVMGGGLMVFFSQRTKRKQLAELHKSIESFFDKNGIDEFQQYRRQQNLYDFYKRHILPELQTKQKD